MRRPGSAHVALRSDQGLVRLAERRDLLAAEDALALEAAAGAAAGSLGHSTGHHLGVNVGDGLGGDRGMSGAESLPTGRGRE